MFLQQLEGLLQLNKYFEKICKLRSDPIKEMNEYMENTKVYTALNSCVR